MKVKKAVILAAGYGTRRLPATKAIPKEMLPVADKPAIQYIAEEAALSGIEDILIVLSGSKECIREHFCKDSKLLDFLVRTGKAKEAELISMKEITANILYLYQDEMKGSGAAIGLCESFASSQPIAVLFGDDIIYNPKKPCLAQLIDGYETIAKTIVGVQNVTEDTARKCGVIRKGKSIDRLTEIRGIIEKPSIGTPLPSSLASLGRFILTPDIFDVLRVTPQRNGEVYLTEAIDLMSRSAAGAYAYEFEGLRYDIGDKLGYLIANIEYGLRDEKINKKLADYLKSNNTTFDL